MTRHFILQGTHSPAIFACHLVAVGLAALLIFALSRYERRLVTPRLGVVLLSLRLCVLVVILLTLLQPTFSWTLDQRQVGRILVGVDLSQSMSTVDRHSSQGEKFRVARGLEMIGAAGQEERLDRWQKAFDSDQEPEWVDPNETQDPERRATLVASRRELVQSLFKEIDKLPRTEVAWRLIMSSKQPLIEELDRLGRVEMFVFAGKSETLERDQLAKSIAKPSATLIPETTDLSLALQQGSSGGDVMGMILFTDGRDHAGQNLTGVAAGFKSANLPVYPVMIGSSYRPKDLSIMLLEHPQSVYKGDHPLLKVTIGTFGFSGTPITVELMNTDDPNAKPIRQNVVSRGMSAELDFDLSAEEIGRQNFVVRIPVQEGETREDNNERSFSFRVVDDRAKVFLVDGEARWEFRYLNDAFSRDERVNLKTLLFDQPYIGRLPEPFFPRRWQLPDDVNNLPAAPFAESDMVIVGDVTPEQFPDPTWKLLLKYVSDGGTLVLSAGHRDMPLAHRSTALEQLLPVTKMTAVNLADEITDAPPVLRGLPLKLTADGEQQPMLQFAADVSQNTSIWKGLPGQTWAILGEAKPGATVWATTQIPAGRIPGLSADRRFGVIVHQFIGTGQVVWIGIDATWRWRYRVGDRYHHRFWAQLARWAAIKTATGNDFVRFGPEKSELELGQDAQIKATWTTAFLQRYPKLKAQAEFYRQGEKADRPQATIDLKPHTNQPQIFEGRALSLPSGEYKVRLIAEHASLGEKPIEAALYVHDRPSEELSDLSTNRELLVKIAELSGGRLFLPDEIRQIPKLFQKTEEKTPQYSETTLWDRWPWLVILFSLMMCEWVLRKLNGLP